MSMDLREDRLRYSFTDTGPWEIDESKISWKAGIEVIRLNSRRAVPLLTAQRRMPDVSRLTVVSARLGTAVIGWALNERRKGGSDSRAGLSRRLRVAAERLGPTYIKLAQIISSGEGLFPPELVGELSKCRDQVPSEEFAQVRAVVEAELGAPLSEVFSHFEEKPIAAASIAQVHAATLVSGEEVVVKVQRPTIRSLVHSDLRVMSWLAPFMVGRIPVAALANPPALVELFAETITEELDFRLEAENMLDVARAFAQLGTEGYVVPRPHPELVTRRVLVMQRLHGFAFEDLDSLVAAGIDTHKLIRTAMKGFTEGCMVQGIFHGDLHAGNLFVTPEGDVALLDFGITARMTPLERSGFLRMMLAGASGDIKGQITAFRDLGALPPDTDIDWVVSELGLDQDAVDPTTLGQDELLQEIQRVIKSLLAMGAKLPKILMLYVKNLVFLDGAIARLAPDLDLVSEVAELSTHMATTHGATIAADLGLDTSAFSVDTEAIKAGFGVVDSTEAPLTHRDLQKRRELIRKRLGR